jgi:hypothetical protein
MLSLISLNARAIILISVSDLLLDPLSVPGVLAPPHPAHRPLLEVDRRPLRPLRGREAHPLLQPALQPGMEFLNGIFSRSF